MGMLPIRMSTIASRHRSPKRQLRRTDETGTVLYTSKEGVHQAYKEYFNAEVVVGRDEITTDFPEHEWVICESWV